MHLNHRVFIAFLLILQLFSCEIASSHCAVPQSYNEISCARNLNSILDVFNRVAPWTKGKIEVQYCDFKNHANPKAQEARLEILEKQAEDLDFDRYEYYTKDGKLIIRANSIQAAGVAFNHYLRNYCHRSFSMIGSNMSPITTLPEVKLSNCSSNKECGVANCHYRHFFNFCTLNYSSSFWTWEEWERMIDYMVLNGVNLTISTVGLEKVWYNTLLKYGFTEDEIFEFLPGPAFNAWHIMGNLEGWGGPITKNMMEKRARLGQKIIKRLKKYGIEPITSAFYGMVPTKLKLKYPGSHIIPQGNWVGGFVRPDILSPLDSLYKEISTTYYNELKNLYGDFKFFAGEPFHEGGIREGIDVAKMSNAVFSQMRTTFPEAQWFLQSWGQNPTREFLSGLSKKGDVLIWDFRGERSADWEIKKGYYGYPFLWGVINNFGETTGLYGKLERFVQEYFRSAELYPQNMVGLGCSPEGLLNNPVNYDLLFDIPWHNEAFPVAKWLKSYVSYRYGLEFYKNNMLSDDGCCSNLERHESNAAEQMYKVWKILLQTAYSSSADQSKQDPISNKLPQILGTPESIICAVPSLNIKSVSSWGTSYLFYDEDAFEKIIPYLIAASSELENCDAFSYDLVNFTRQILANRFHKMYDEYVLCVKRADLASMNKISASMIEILDKMGNLLSTRKEFMLGYWLEQASNFGDTEYEKDLCVWNAKAQISYWGSERDDTSLRDYAHKEWSGLILTLYKPRWEQFFAECSTIVTMQQKRTLSEQSEANSFSGLSGTSTYISQSIQWSHEKVKFSSEPIAKTTAEAVSIAVKILEEL